MCDKCNKNINRCACEEPEFCGCAVNLDVGCTFYSGRTLEPIGIVGGMNGSEILIKINEYIKNILQNLDISPTVIESVGDGVVVYKGLSTGFIEEFKSLVGIEGIKITPSENTVRFEVDKSWLQTSLTQQWFVDLIKNLFNTPEFNQFFSQYFTTLIQNGDIDICALIDKCTVTPPVDNPPVISGDIVYNPPNRATSFPLNSTDFIAKYSDPEGDVYAFIKITGGDLTGLVKSNLQPLTLNDIIPISEVSQIKYSGPNQDAASTQIVNYVAINNKGQQSN